MCIFTVPTANLITAPEAAVERYYVHFICEVTGSPKPTIRWYKNRSLLGFTSVDRAYTFPLSGGGELLRLGPVRQSRHRGDYQCEASNDNGSAKSQAVSLQIYKGWWIFLYYTCTTASRFCSCCSGSIWIGNKICMDSPFVHTVPATVYVVSSSLIHASFVPSLAVGTVLDPYWLQI